jgi:protein-tyrosine phosphatase
MAGISRSVTLVLAYLMKYKGNSYEEAFDIVQKKRRVVM